MPGDSLQEQLVKYLTDAHSTERTALSRLRASIPQDLDQLGVAA